MTAVIEVTGLTKRYGGQAVVDDIAFHVDAGEIFGILGPNGAGKTTAVECMEGLRRRDGGEVRILGLDPLTDRHRLHQRIGVQLQESQLQEKLKVREALELYASFYPNPADWRELLERWGLAGKADARFAKLSGGQKQRLFIALALIGNPEVVFLDELTSGPGPGRAARHLGPDQPGPGAGRHRRAGQPLHGRGGGTVRPRRDPRTGADRGAGHPGGAGGPRRGRVPGAVPADGPAGLPGLDEQSLTALPGVISATRRGNQVDVTGTGDFASAVTAELARRQVLVADLRIEGRSLDSAYVALTGRSMES